MKKMTALIAGAMLSAAMLVPAYAGLPEINIEFNGEIVETEQPPVIEDGRILVPFRFFADTFGAKTSWDAKTKTVTCTYGGTTISMTAYSKVMKLNGQNIAVEVPVDIVNDRVMVPIRIIATGFGANVSWDANSRTAIVNTGDVHFNRVNTAGNVSFTYAETASENTDLKASAKYPVFTGDFGSLVNMTISGEAKSDVEAFEKECASVQDISKCQFTSSYEVQYNDSGIVSILNTRTSDKGSGETAVLAAKTYNTADGTEITISDNDINSAVEAFKSLMSDKTVGWLENAADKLKSDNIGWYIDRDGKTVFFVNAGTLAKESVGAVTVTLEKNAALEAIAPVEDETVVPDNTVSASAASADSIDLSKLSSEKLFASKGNVSITTVTPMISGNYSSLNTALRNMTQALTDAMTDEYWEKPLDYTNSPYSGTIELSLTFADSDRVCVLVTENVKSGDSRGVTTLSAKCLNISDGSVADDGSNLQLKTEGADLINEVIKNDSTGVFTEGAVVKPEDVGYYYDEDGTIFFVNEGIAAAASLGPVTVEKFN